MKLKTSSLYLTIVEEPSNNKRRPSFHRSRVRGAYSVAEIEIETSKEPPP